MTDLSISSMIQALDNVVPSNTCTRLQTLQPLPAIGEVIVQKNNLGTLLDAIQEDIIDLKQNILGTLGTNRDSESIKSFFVDTEKAILERKNVFMDNSMDYHTNGTFLTEYNLNNALRLIEEDEKLLDTCTKDQPERMPLSTLQSLKTVINPACYDEKQFLRKKYGVPSLQRFPARKATAVKPLKPVRRKLPDQPLFTSPCPMEHKKAILHNGKVQSETRISELPSAFNTAFVKVDHQTFSHDKKGTTADIQRIKSREPVVTHQTSFDPNHSKTMPGSMVSLHRNSLNCLLTPLSPPNSVPSQTHCFVIKNGGVRSHSKDFIHFKHFYNVTWSCIETVLRRLEQLMVDYSVPIAYIDGDRLADMGLFFEIGPKPTIKDLLVCVINSTEVERIIRIPGRRYLASDGKEKAACKIQSKWRGYHKNSLYLAYRRKKWGAGMIALRWMMKCKMSMIRAQVKQKETESLMRFRKRAREFKSKWVKINSGKRMLIHLPSLGYNGSVRQLMGNISMLESCQVGRLCDIKDPNVEVLYISASPITEEMMVYYEKIIQMMCDTTGEKYNDACQRLKFLTPQHYNKFPTHNLCLSSLLKYSVKTVKRVQSLIKGKTAYIVPGIVHKDDLYIADVLDLPLLGSEPDIVQKYSLKSCTRQVFESAGVAVPPGTYNVFTRTQLHECLAQLVTENLQVTRWLFKIDNQVNGMGTAYCDIAPYLKCYVGALKEEHRYGEKWKKRWAYEKTYTMILAEIPGLLKKAIPINTTLYQSVETFFAVFLRQGGVIEAYPPSDSITGLTANLLITPDDCIEILSVADQIHAPSTFTCCGYTLPQASIESNVVNSAAISVARTCKQRGILGHISVDFVTFINPRTACQDIWAVGLKLSYSNCQAMFNLISFFSGGQLDVNNSTYEVAIQRQSKLNSVYQSRKNKMTQSIEEKLKEKCLRHCVFSATLFHTNLSTVHTNVFFQMCKARIIGYDSEMKLGSIFVLYNHLRKENLGMIVIGETLHEAVECFYSNLSMIHQDISSSSMQGKSNFHEMMAILKTIFQTLQINKSIDRNPTL